MEEPELSPSTTLVMPAQEQQASKNSVLGNCASAIATSESVCRDELLSHQLPQPFLSEMVSVGSSAESASSAVDLDKPQLDGGSLAVCEDEGIETMLEGKPASLQLVKEPEKLEEATPQCSTEAMPDAVCDLEPAVAVSRANEPAMATGSEPERSRVYRPSMRIGLSGSDPAVPTSEPTAQSVPLKKKLIIERIPPNLQAVVSRNIEPPMPTKSLPSRMERMKFRNRSEIAIRQRTSRKSKVVTCVIYIRPQGLSRSAPGNTHSFTCHSCNFRTSRMNNLVQHMNKDCARVKDFFSWDAKTFTEATEMSRKRSLSPDVLIEDEVAEEASKTSMLRKRSSRDVLIENEVAVGTSKKLMMSRKRPSPDVVLIEEVAEGASKTPMSRKRSSPDVVLIENEVAEEASKIPVVKHKGSPRKSEPSAKTPEQKKSVESDEKSEQAPGVYEESSEEEAPTSKSAPPQEKPEFGRFDIVWVEWKKHLHWPGLVIRVIPKKKKASVMLIDALTTKPTVMMSLKKIDDFNNAERNRRYLSRARVGSWSGALVTAVHKAEEYLRKRCLGSNVSPRQFFWDEVPFTEGPPSVNSDDVYLDPLCSGLASEGAGDAVDEVAVRIKDKRKQCIERLLQCIRGGKVNSHVLGVLNGSVPSERHSLFDSELYCERAQLKEWTWFGPIDDVPQQEEIYELCFELFKANSDPDPSFDIASYVIEVLCPEAVMKALSLTLGIDMDKAEEVLLRASILNKAERETRRQNPTDAAQEHDARFRRELHNVGIADDILLAFDS